jgi:hypothetical protein
MAEGDCGQVCGTLQCPGTIVASSSTLIRTNSQYDYSLVQLPTNPTATYGYATFREAGATAGERMYIPQHPGGWGKQIAVESTDPHDASGYAEVDAVQVINITGSGLRTCVLYFADTAGGSSGSPVFGYADNQIIGLHFGAFGCTGLGNGATAIQEIIADLGPDVPPGALAIFIDGFESANTSAWSTTVP